MTSGGGTRSIPAFTVLTTSPDVPAAPLAPPRTEAIDWPAVHGYLRALFAGQGIRVDWRGEQPTGVTPVYISRPLLIQWHALAPIIRALDVELSQAATDALASGDMNQWISLRRIQLEDWTDIRVDDVQSE